MTGRCRCRKTSQTRGRGRAEPPSWRGPQTETSERNFENSSTRTTTVREAGELASLSVSVVVDQIATRGEDGASRLKRSLEELDQIRNLVAAAVGFPLDVQARTENQILQVEQMRFSRPDLSLGTPAPTGFSWRSSISCASPKSPFCSSPPC
jgi:flagellar M-ring protein FliF